MVKHKKMELPTLYFGNCSKTQFELLVLKRVITNGHKTFSVGNISDIEKYGEECDEYQRILQI